MSIHRRRLQILSIIVIASFMFSGFGLPSASAQGKDGLKRQVNAQTGKVSFLSPESGRVVSSAKALGTAPGMRPADPAMALAKRFGPEFGLKDSERDLKAVKTKRQDDGRMTIRYQQSYQGIPVMGGELIVNTNENGDLYSINGEISPDLSMQTQPTIDAEQARQTALRGSAKWYEKAPDDFLTSAPELWIYDESLLQPSTRPPELVWRMEITLKDAGLPVRELVLVNAERGHISLHFNQIDMAWEGGRKTRSGLNATKENPLSSHDYVTTNSTTNAAILLLTPVVNTYTAGNGLSLPGTLLCNQADPNCAAGDSHAKAAHEYAIGTYNLYATQHSRDSIDNHGMTMISSVHYASGYANAFWNGSQMVYGDANGYPLADDVVAHELTHGVTQYESNLFYYYQPGAINESFSDLWGEYYDQTNGQGTDSAGVRWQIGEDISGIGALRSMSNPTLFIDPDRMSSLNYYEGAADNGGVHTNSGVNNKAAFLMVDGGTFNGKVVTALGWDKTAAIYYEASANLLSSGADYSDLYFALQLACSNLIRHIGINSGHCAEVKDAIDAVEMNGQPALNFNTDAPYCNTGSPITFSDDLESGTGNWTFTNGTYLRWQVDSPDGPYAHSGNHSLYADDYPDEVTDANARLASFIVPSNAYLHFAQAYDFEASGNYYDGGVLEYSLNGGSSWVDAGSLIDFNGYKGTIFTGAGNPLSGRSAFVGTSHGYISTRLNLASLAGNTVTFRWRMGLDQAVGAWGWWVDDVQIYQCSGLATNVSMMIGSQSLGEYKANFSPSLMLNFPNTLNGPVKVIGKNGLPIFTSQRVVYGNSFNELMGYPANRFTTEYWFPWYDMVYMNTWILVGNPSTTQTAYVDIYIGGVKQNNTPGGVPYGIPPGDRVVPQFPNVLDGPVRVVSVTGAGTASPLPIFASERSTYLSSFNEVMGYPANQFTTEYWFPWYDQVYMNTWILVGNPSATQTAYVDIYIGGVKRGSYPIPPNGRVLPQFPSVVDGPVKVVSTTGTGTPAPLPVFASERSTYQGSFNEVMGSPADQFTTDYWYTWYDNQAMASWILVGNPSTTQTAYVDIYIGGFKQNNTYTIPPNGSIIPRFDRSSGPVRILSVTGAGTPTAVPIFTSERSLYGPSFNEVMGYPANQLSSEYWFTWYDSVYMNTNIYVSKP